MWNIFKNIKWWPDLLFSTLLSFRFWRFDFNSKYLMYSLFYCGRTFFGKWVDRSSETIEENKNIKWWKDFAMMFHHFYAFSSYFINQWKSNFTDESHLWDVLIPVTFDYATDELSFNISSLVVILGLVTIERSVPPVCGILHRI